MFHVSGFFVNKRVYCWCIFCFSALLATAISCVFVHILVCSATYQNAISCTGGCEQLYRDCYKMVHGSKSEKYICKAARRLCLIRRKCQRVEPSKAPNTLEKCLQNCDVETRLCQNFVDSIKAYWGCTTRFNVCRKHCKSVWKLNRSSSTN